MSIFALRSNGLASSAYKNLSRAQTSLNDNISRLASGLRINKTADDSAGSNVSVRMGNQVSGMAQANRNAQNTHNLLATAESGLSDISDILSKMRELSVQASTDTLNDVDRASINLEFQALKDEFTRIANVTEYNGMNVLNGTYQTAEWPLPETSIIRANVHSDGTEGNSRTWNHSISADGRYVAFSSHATNLVNSDNNGQEDIFIYDRQTGITERVSAHSNGTEGNGQSNADWDVAGLISANGRSILFESHASNLVDDDNNGNKDLFVANNPLYETRSHWRVQIGADNDINNQHEFSLKNATANGLGLEADNVLSVDDARAAITAIDHAIDEVNHERSYIGSEQNKLQFTMSNLSNNIQNIEASRSSIEDADFAAEAADLAKNQILAQSGTAMLAQASAISQNILGLLA